MLVPHKKQHLPLLAGLVFSLCFVFHYRNTDHIYGRWSFSLRGHDSEFSANRTLGFGAVVVISKEGSKRRHALLQAANVTDLDFTIPEQPKWTEHDIQSFRDGHDDGVQHGSLLAWMGHHHALQWFLDSGVETALILEDDVDWDIRLRTIQVPLAASAVRTMMPPRQLPNFLTKHHTTQTQYWGDHSAWDLLYLGHCGDYFNEVTYDGLALDGTPYTLNDVAHIIYDDPTVPIRSELHPFTRSLFDAIGMPEHSRTFHHSKFPLCSFGYAITRPAARLLLGSLAPRKLQPGGPRAFDVALLHACLKGSRETRQDPARWASPLSHHDRGLRCWTLNSELFHHMLGESEIATVGKSMGEETGQGWSPVDWVGRNQTILRNETSNIGCGFWSGAFAFDDSDEESLDFLRQEVGIMGRCLKDGKDAS